MVHKNYHGNKGLHVKIHIPCISIIENGWMIVEFFCEELRKWWNRSWNHHPQRFLDEGFITLCLQVNLNPMNGPWTSLTLYNTLQGLYRIGILFFTYKQYKVLLHQSFNNLELPHRVLIMTTDYHYFEMSMSYDP